MPMFFESEQIKVRSVIMRGGTSRAVFLNENVLPKSKEKREKFILSLFGSPDKRQIDGLGGADILTSKCAIIGPPSQNDADIDYTFAQVGIEDPYISFDINCGNISPAAGVYAIEEGFIRATDPITTVRIYNTNTKKILKAKVPTRNGVPLVDGSFSIDGVPGTGAEVGLDYSETLGAATGKLLPTGNVVDEIFVPSLKKKISISIVDLANISVFFLATDIGMTGTEKPEDFPDEKLTIFEDIRQVAAEKVGLSKDNRILPFQIMVGERDHYQVFSTGKIISKDDIDLTGRMAGKNGVHQAFPGTGSCCTAVASLIKGTIVNQKSKHEGRSETVRIGHPSGTMEIKVDVHCERGDWKVNEVILSRTARRIMEGYAYIQKSRL
jgi:2-methylaconitate cis-trans-isomerase PrpF